MRTDGVRKLPLAVEFIPFRGEPWQITSFRTVRSARPEELPCPHLLRWQATTTLRKIETQRSIRSSIHRNRAIALAVLSAAHATAVCLHGKTAPVFFTDSGVVSGANSSCRYCFNSASTCVASFVLIVRYSSSLSPPRACKSLNFASNSLGPGWSSAASPRNLLTTTIASASRANIAANHSAAQDNG